MDAITRKLDNYITISDFDGRSTDVACYNKIKMDYLLMLTFAATLDLKYSNMDHESIKAVITGLQRLMTGNLVRIIEKNLNLDISIVNIFDLFKQGRNLMFGHTTFDEFAAKELNEECVKCWEALINLQDITDDTSKLLLKLYQEYNDFFYIASVKQDDDMLVKQFGKKDGYFNVPKCLMKANMINKANIINKRDLFISVDNSFIKVSPFIQFDENKELFMMLIDIESSPLAFKMAYVYKTQYASDSVKYLEEFPTELREFFPQENEKQKKNGVALNRFLQYDLFMQEYYHGVHIGVQMQLDNFVTGNMAYGAVRGVGGVGKTSAVFMWMKRILNNEEGVLDRIRQNFKLGQIIFLSAKTKIFSRDVNADNLSNFYDLGSDVSNYHDVIECVFSIFHPSKKTDIIFDNKVNFLKNYSNQSHGILIIIDDYESLPLNSREMIQELKNYLRPNIVKMLITTRFASKESKDIVVEGLSKEECAQMTDHIFSKNEWRTDITVDEMHALTGGLPLLIWYAKAYFQTGQLSSELLRRKYSGPAEGLEEYLFDNFIECFEDEFTKNFLMISTRYYQLHNVLQISRRTAVFLCLREPKDYKSEYEEQYFRELIDLKLISINQTTDSIDFSPLMTYMDKSLKKQEPQSQYQEDSLKILAQLDEERYKNLFAVVASAEFLEDETKCRILKRIITFTKNDEDILIHAIRKLFALSSEKLRIYEDNMQLFQNNHVLITTMINYILNNEDIIISNYEMIRDFIFSISVSMATQDPIEQIASKGSTLVIKLLEYSYKERTLEHIVNKELEKRTKLLCDLAVKFAENFQDKEEKQRYFSCIIAILDNISIYCDIPTIEIT